MAKAAAKSKTEKHPRTEKEDARVTGTEGKVDKAKKWERCGESLEISVRLPGYIARSSRIVDITKLDAAERAELLDDLIDGLVAELP